MRIFYNFLYLLDLYIVVSFTYRVQIELKMLMLTFLSVLCIVKIIVYYLITKPQRYWKRQETPHEKPELFFGNLKEVILRKTSMAEYLQYVYQKYEGNRYVGIYQFSKPAIILRDLRLINEITVKEFEIFSQHVIYTSAKADPIWAHNLFAMPGDQHWKDMRATLSPAFTSNKLRTLFYLIDKCAQLFANHLAEKNDFVKLEMKDAFTKVTNDIIASSALGATCDSTKYPKNEIFLMGSEACNLSEFPKSLKFFINNISPTMAKLIGVRFISEKTRLFFNGIIQKSIKVREETSLIRPDIIHLLMEAKRGRLKVDASTDPVSEFAAVSESTQTFEEKSAKIEITDDIMTAQAVIFFLAGFDTSSTAMGFAAYELALHPNVQQRLIEEVDHTLEVLDGVLTYDVVVHMKYLDMVVSEVLRKWPPFAVTDRTATLPYTIKPLLPNERPVHINENVICLIPIYALHRDERYFPQPDTFDPERFNEENKPNFPSAAYMPFGNGRRNCIGSRFALLEIKIVLIRILSKFEIVPIEETPIPIVLSKVNVNPISDKGFWLGLKPRIGRREPD